MPEPPKIVVTGFRVILRTWDKKHHSIISEKAIGRTYTVRASAEQLSAMMNATGVDTYVHPVQRLEGGRPKK